MLSLFYIVQRLSIAGNTTTTIVMDGVDLLSWSNSPLFPYTHNNAALDEQLNNRFKVTIHPRAHTHIRGKKALNAQLLYINTGSAPGKPQ